jgi:cytochrome P450
MTIESPIAGADLLDPELWRQENDEQREQVFTRLRDEAPVSFQEDREFLGMEPGPGFWSIVRNQDIRDISRNPKVFSAQGAMQYFDWPEGIGSYYDSVVELDAPKHTAFRKIIAPAFSPEQVRGWRDRIRRIVREVIADAAPLGECDFTDHFAEQVPLRITAAMLGIPSSYWHDIVEASFKYLHCYDPEVLPKGLESVKEGNEEMAEIALELHRHYRAQPAENLTSMLANTEFEDPETGVTRTLTEDEYVAYWVTMVTGGTETTRMTLNHGTYQLTHNPDQRERWRGDPDLTRNAVEEMIRWTSPQGYFRRVATEDTEVAGVEIQRGDRLVLWYCSGNRDALAFERPYEFDITRDPNPHVSFGGGGPHFCIGVGIARIEIGIFFEEMFKLLPDLEISGPMERVHGFYMPDVKRMPCRFTPRTIELDD